MPYVFVYSNCINSINFVLLFTTARYMVDDIGF